MRKKTEDEREEMSESRPIGGWDDEREISIASERTRQDDKRVNFARKPSRHRGNLWFPEEQIPVGWIYGWFTERLLGEPQNDNLQEAYENGWDFVKQSDHPEYMIRELYANSDNRIRRRNNILMKKPKKDYDADQQYYQEETEAKEREVSQLTDLYGHAPNDPRYVHGSKFIVENSTTYNPNYVHKRG